MLAMCILVRVSGCVGWHSDALRRVMQPCLEQTLPNNNAVWVCRRGCDACHAYIPHAPTKVYWYSLATFSLARRRRLTTGQGWQGQDRVCHHPEAKVRGKPIHVYIQNTLRFCLLFVSDACLPAVFEAWDAGRDETLPYLNSLGAFGLPLLLSLLYCHYGTRKGCMLEITNEVRRLLGRVCWLGACHRRARFVGV